MNTQLLGRLMIGLGLLLVLIGGFTLLSGDDGDSPGASATADPAPAVSASSSSSTSSTSTSTTTPPTLPPTGDEAGDETEDETGDETEDETGDETEDETVEEFIALLDEALATGDVDGELFSRIHQATLDRYGEEPCRAYLAGLPPQERGLRIREVAEPAPWRYETDGVALTIADAIGVEVDRIVNGETRIQELHVAVIDGRFEWFTDCGDPLALG